MNALRILLTGILALPAAAGVDVPIEQALEDDVVLRAMVDELDRDLAGLALEGLAKPYFIEFALFDGTSAWAYAEFGAIVGRNEGRSRFLRSDVRVGSYELDNTNFGWGGGYYRGGAQVPIEDDYNAIRQALWWIADRDYKNVAETFVQKKAFMESKLIQDKPNDFSREEPVVSLAERIRPDYGADALAQLAATVSAVFRDYPDIQDAGVTVSASGGNAYLVSSEGTRLRVAGETYMVSVRAEVQADDGMPLSDGLQVYAEKAADLPAGDELADRTRKMVERLIAVKNAPRLDELYVGPILFDAPAAAALFLQYFSSEFAGGQGPVGSGTSPDDFANKLNRRILPRSMSVVDDPTRAEIDGVSVMGHYRYDDQGVPARPVQLVEGGRLKALLMSRNPSREFDRSTGHGRGLFGPQAAPACQIVTVDDGLGTAELKQELLDAAADEGLPYALRVADLGDSSATPLVIYKVYADGREELVRGGQIAEYNLKAFKRLLACGDTLHVLNRGNRMQGQTVAAPAMLFEELDMAAIDRDFDKPPILPSPLARTAP